MDSWRETVALVEARLAAGSGLPEERQNALANLARSEAALPPLQASLRQARYRLDVLSGQPPGATALALTAPAAAPLAGQLPLGDVNQLIRQRPDVVRAERLLAASSEDVGAATAELYPRLSLGGFIGFFALRGSSVFDGGARAFALAPTISHPAFHLGSARARVRGTQAVAQGALAGYEQAMLLAQEEVENAVTQLAENQTRLASLLQSARHGSAALQIASTRFQAGAGSYQAVLENQRALYDIRREALQSETASYTSAVALYQALGWGLIQRVINHAGDTMFEQASWLNQPKKWTLEDGTLRVTSDDKTDFWRKTSYGFIRDSGHFFGVATDGDFTAQVHVAGHYATLYDQAGLMVRIDAGTLDQMRRRVFRRPAVAEHRADGG